MNREQIKYSLTNRELKLSNRNKFTHYGIVGFCFLIPLVFAFLYLDAYFGNTPNRINSEWIWFLVVPTLIGILFYYLQKKRLKFKEVKTSLSRKELNEIIERIANELEWTLFFKNSKVIVAKTHPSFFSGSWGEQITILFDNRKVLVNSICDPDKQTSVVSMGRNKQNENKLIKEIE
jgi:hypothetical protein